MRNHQVPAAHNINEFPVFGNQRSDTIEHSLSFTHTHKKKKRKDQELVTSINNGFPISVNTMRFPSSFSPLAFEIKDQKMIT